MESSDIKEKMLIRLEHDYSAKSRIIIENVQDIIDHLGAKTQLKSAVTRFPDSPKKTAIQIQLDWEQKIIKWANRLKIIRDCSDLLRDLHELGMWYEGIMQSKKMSLFPTHQVILDAFNRLMNLNPPKIDMINMHRQNSGEFIVQIVLVSESNESNVFHECHLSKWLANMPTFIRIIDADDWQVLWENEYGINWLQKGKKEIIAKITRLRSANLLLEIIGELGPIIEYDFQYEMEEPD